MPKISWKTILHENLLILAYPFDSNKGSTQNNLVSCENSKDLQDIVNFILLRMDPGAYEELLNLMPNTNERQSRLIYLRKLFNWCNELIIETFNDFKCNSALFIAPKGPQIYEFLGRLTMCVLIRYIKQFQKNSTSTLRPRNIMNDLQSTGKSFPNITSEVKEDFVRETQAYLEYLNMLVTRKEAVDKELKSLVERRCELFKQIRNLKKELNFDSVTEINEINEDSIALYDADISKRLIEVNSHVDKLTGILQRIITLCDNIKTSFVNKSDDVKIDISSLTKNQNNSLIAGNEEISFERMLEKLKINLQFNKESYDGFIIRNEEKRVKGGIERIESSLSQNVMNISKTKQNLLKLQNKIVDKSNEIISSAKILPKFMLLPNFESFVENYGNEIDKSSEKDNEIDKSSTSDSKEDLIEPNSNDDENSIIEESIEDLDCLKRNSQEIITNFEEEISISDDWNFQEKRNYEGYLGSPASGYIIAQEDSRKLNRTYDASAEDLDCLKRNSQEIIKNIEEEININDDWKCEEKTNYEGYLGSPASGYIIAQEDSRKSKTTYDAAAGATRNRILLQKLPQETINNFLNWPAESDLSRNFTDSDFLDQPNPNESFFCSPSTKCSLKTGRDFRDGDDDGDCDDSAS